MGILTEELRKAMECIANAQTFLRESSDERAEAEAQLLEVRLDAIARIREASTGGRK